MQELQRVFEVAQEDPLGVSWIATRKPGYQFQVLPDSRLLAFANGEAGNALALTARVVARYGAPPSTALVRGMYEVHGDIFRAYWKITDVELKIIPYEDLPGTTVKGLRIPDAFRRSRLSFAYWLSNPPGDGVPVHRCAPTPTCSATQRIDRPTVPLHGVDFSGAREISGRNRKIWIASWYPDRAFVQLRSGGDDSGFGRIGLAEMIIEGGGTWVVDFPFGPPAAVAAAAGWTTWQEYTAWCGSDPDPTALRDQLRERCLLAGVPWTQKREIDRTLGTTWFPFFEQLYRQTITGGRDVLRLLDQASRDSVRILPFHNQAPATDELSVVVEGFPGATLRQCGLPSTGYKQTGDAAQEKRRVIVDSLRERGIPICEAVASAAVRDAGGDALDALVLLCASGTANRRVAEWTNWVGVHSGIEGWFFD